ncbi:MAG: hypothetical protein ACF8PN_16080 [Phycisphaerales bacterium]
MVSQRVFRSISIRTLLVLATIAIGPALGVSAQEAPSSAADLPELRYVKQSTRKATREATLDQYLPAGLKFGPWWTVGPFANEWTQVAGHENGGYSLLNRPLLPEKGFDPDAVYIGKNGLEVRWEKREDLPDNSAMDLHLYEDESLQDDLIVYLYRTISVDEPVDLEVTMGSDDMLKVWFNGRVVVNADVLRGWAGDQHRVVLPLEPGENHLLAKVGEHMGGFNYSFSYRNTIDPMIDTMLEYQLDKDFPRSREDEFYPILTIPVPDEVVLEVGGLDTMPDGRPAVSTRRGDVWIVERAYEDPPFFAEFKRFASGLHEPLGLAAREDGLFVVQRPELTRLVDSNGDDQADLYETVTDDWGVSGNYHEFAFGPEFDLNGDMWVSLNVGFCGALGKSVVPWRGWALKVTPTGEMQPVCGGMRSPNGLGMNADGEMFYTDNQGDWVGTNKLSHLKRGVTHGHPSSNRWFDHPDGPGPNPGKPAAGPDGPIPMHEAKEAMPTLQLPAVWFPLVRMGRSASDILLDDTGGEFGPFEGQLFVGDQFSSMITRVFLEKVDGEYQGACFPFRWNFECGVNRMCWGKDGSMFVGMTDRGWGSVGRKSYGLQRVVWSGKTPFEPLEMRAKSDGFEIEFTKPVDPSTAGDPASYSMESFTYLYHEPYGSDEFYRETLNITDAMVSEDRLTVRLLVDGLRAGFVHELHLDGVRSIEGEELLHAEAYYTLNAIPAAADQASRD